MLSHGMEKQDTKFKIETVQKTKKATSLIELSAIPLASEVIKIYDEQGFMAMINYVSNLKVGNNQIPEDLIDTIYFVITKVFKRGDILVHRLFYLYQNSGSLDQILNHLPTNIKNLLVRPFVAMIALPRADIDKEQFQQFIQAMIMHDDIIWQARIYRALEPFLFEGSYDKRDEIKSLRDALGNRIDELAKNISSIEQARARDFKKINISDEHIKLANDLVDNVLLPEFFEEDEYSKQLNKLDPEQLDQIISYILVELIDKFQDQLIEDEDEEPESGLDAFTYLLGLSYPDETIREDKMSLILGQLKDYYPQAFELSQFKKDIPGKVEIIEYLRKAVFKRQHDKIINLSKTEEESSYDAIIDEIHENYKRFGKLFLIDLFNAFYASIGSQRMATVLKRITDKLLESPSGVDKKLRRAILNIASNNNMDLNAI